MLVFVDWSEQTDVTHSGETYNSRELTIVRLWQWEIGFSSTKLANDTKSQ